MIRYDIFLKDFLFQFRTKNCFITILILQNFNLPIQFSLILLHSGFKEPSTSVISTSPTNENFKTIPITKSNRSQKRGSIRIKILQEHEESLTETERILKRTLKIHNMIHPLEKISDTMNRFNPKVICSNLSNYEITRKINLGTIIPKVEEFPNEIEFRGLILHRWMSFDGEHPHYFVRWIPLNILDDEWIVADYATAVKLKKKVKLSDLNLQQRREICERIFKGVKI